MGENVLGVSRPLLSVRDFTFKEVASFFRKVLRGKKVKKAYLFGSFAANEAGYWSDIDVLIVVDTDRSFIERPKEFLDLFDLGLPIDILVYTPEEFDVLMKEPRGFWKSFQITKVRIL